MRTAFVIGALILSTSIGSVKADFLLWIILSVTCVFWLISDIPDFIKGVKSIKNILSPDDGVPFKDNITE